MRFKQIDIQNIKVLFFSHNSSVIHRLVHSHTIIIPCEVNIIFIAVNYAVYMATRRKKNFFFHKLSNYTFLASILRFRIVSNQRMLSTRVKSTRRAKATPVCKCYIGFPRITNRNANTIDPHKSVKAHAIQCRLVLWVLT